MSKKIQNTGNYTTVVDTDNSNILFESPTSEVRYIRKGDSIIEIYQEGERTFHSNNLQSSDDVFVDSGGAAIVDIYDWLSENTGQNVGDGGNTPPVAKTGNNLVFTEPAVYNELSYASDDIVLDNINAIVGTVVSIYHQKTSVPNFTAPTGKKLFINTNEYSIATNEFNIIYFIITPDGNFEATIKSYPVYAEPYETEVQDIIDLAITNSETIPSTTVLNKINAFIKGLKNIRDDADTTNTNLLNTLDTIYLAVDSNKEFAKYDYLTGTKKAGEVGTMGYNSEGFEGTPGSAIIATDAMNTDADLVNFSQNNASIYIYQTGHTNNGFLVGSYNDDTTIRNMIGYSFGSGKYNMSLNGNAPSYTGTYVEGSILIDRLISTEYKLFLNGVLETTIINTSVGIPDREMYIGSRNYLGVSSETDGNIGVFMLGASIRDYQNSLHQLVATLTT